LPQPGRRPDGRCEALLGAGAADRVLGHGSPGTGSVLYGVEAPKDGAATYFANLRMAYDLLSADVKRRIESLDAVYDYGRRAASYSGRQPDAATIRRRFPLVTHKLVYADSVTEAKSTAIPVSTTALSGRALLILAALTRRAWQAQIPASSEAD